jgi:L-ascorbate metabolism protein UlaG (beta-lactamase superfamily)
MTFLQRAVKIGRKFQNPVPTTAGGARVILKAIPMLLRNTEERVPKRALGPFRTDPSAFASAPASGLRITWFGHSSLLVEIDGVRVLIDPVWDQRPSPVQWFGPKRFFAPTLALQDLPRIDAILISHDHFDHLGAGTVRQLASLPAMANARWITSLGVGPILRHLGVKAERISELDWTETVRISASDGAECEFTSLPARHFSGRSALNRFETLWASFALRGSSHSVYFGADSGWWEGFAEIGEKYGPFDLTMLEIGAYNDLWKQIHMGPDGAARVFCDIGGAGLLMPIHWGLFNLALHGWRQPIERLVHVADADGLKVWSPEPGLPTDVVSGVAVRSDWWRT